MVLSTVSSLVVQCNSSCVSHPWFLDSGSSNHMIGSSQNLHNGTQKIQITDGNTLSITNIGDLNIDFRNVLVSLELTSHLLFVGPLVDNNCDVQFSRSGCSFNPFLCQLFIILLIYYSVIKKSAHMRAVTLLCNR